MAEYHPGDFEVDKPILWIRIEPNWTGLLQDFGLPGEDGWDTQRTELLEDHALVDEDCWEKQDSDQAGVALIAGRHKTYSARA